MQFVIDVFRKTASHCIKNNYIQIRPSSYKTSILVKDQSIYDTSYEVTNLPEDWKNVENLLPLSTVPMPQVKEFYPSQWKASLKEVNAPYSVSRTKNHMVPVYLSLTYRGTRRVTMIKKIQGDIWSLESEIRMLLEKNNKKPIRTRVNEFVGNITIHGDHMMPVKNMLLEKGF